MVFIVSVVYSKTWPNFKGKGGLQKAAELILDSNGISIQPCVLYFSHINSLYSNG